MATIINCIAKDIHLTFKSAVKIYKSNGGYHVLMRVSAI